MPARSCSRRPGGHPRRPRCTRVERCAPCPTCDRWWSARAAGVTSGPERSKAPPADLVQERIHIAAENVLAIDSAPPGSPKAIDEVPITHARLRSATLAHRPTSTLTKFSGLESGRRGPRAGVEVQARQGRTRRRSTATSRTPDAASRRRSALARRERLRLSCPLRVRASCGRPTGGFLFAPRRTESRPATPCRGCPRACSCLPSRRLGHRWRPGRRRRCRNWLRDR